VSSVWRAHAPRAALSNASWVVSMRDIGWRCGE
jgi:hypothetical protein